MVYQAAQAVQIPVIGMGGIFSARDALEFIIAGASLVSVGCGLFVKPTLPVEIATGIGTYLDAQGMASITELVSSLRSD
jgi:dihydroorotate dehydrogenase (NAD+) catalytic subunit